MGCNRTGVLNGKSAKQKLNTKSSTEAELVGASDKRLHTMDDLGQKVYEISRISY